MGKAKERNVGMPDFQELIMQSEKKYPQPETINMADTKLWG